MKSDFEKKFDEFNIGTSKLILDAAEAIGKFFGVDAKKAIIAIQNYFGDKQPTYQETYKKITDVFNKLIVKDSADVARLDSKLEALFSTNPSPLIRKLVGEARSSIQAKRSQIVARQARHDLDKELAIQKLNEYDQMTTGEHVYEGSEKRKEVDQAISTAQKEYDNLTKVEQKL